MDVKADIDAATVERIRSFNRFYTRLLGLLDESMMQSGFSLTETRILLELARRDGLTASDLVRDLGLDAGYLSRMLGRFAAAGLVERTPSPEDARQSVLALTKKGRVAFAPLDAGAKTQIARLIEPLDPGQREDLIGAMACIRGTLADRAGAAAGEWPGEVVLRPMRPGDLGWVAHRQGLLYHREYGWDATYEALTARILAGFVDDHDPTRERSWIAERDGRILGSIFLMRGDTPDIARLRLLYVEAEARGLGLGWRLVSECVDFARQAGYSKMTLWTQSKLLAARKLYARAGFAKVKEEPLEAFGDELLSETWELAL